MSSRSDPKSEAGSRLELKASDGSLGLTPQTAHVLFIDIVSYSSLLTDEQPAVLQKLQKIVRATEEFQGALRTNQLLSLPTGDGMALSFFGDLEAPLRCAVEIGRALRACPEFKVRMGIHSGLVYRIADINENLNLSGGGINIAQRVMDCGDAGHIILSKRVADDLGQLSHWAPHLHDLGEAEVKHGVRVHLYNLYNEQFGNPALPAKLQSRTKKLWVKAGAFAIGALLLLVIAALLWWPRSRPAIGPVTPNQNAIEVPHPADKRIFTYYLAPSDKDKRELSERFTGNEQFRNGSRFTLVILPQQAGAFYLLNRGKGPKGATAWNVLFPIPQNRAGSPWVSASDELDVKIRFDPYSGDEALFIIWTPEPEQKLNEVFSAAANTDYEIRDQNQIETIIQFLAKYESPKPIVEVDSDSKLTTVTGNSGDRLITSRILKHREF